LEPITEDTVNFILKRGIYRSQLEKKIKRQEARTIRLRASYKIDNLRRRLKKQIAKAHEEGDYEKEALLQSQLDATYKRKVRTGLLHTTHDVV